MTENQIRKKIIALCLQMNATGLNQGTSGIPYEQLKPADIAKMKIDGDGLEWKGPSKPSSEWHFHRSILQANSHINAIVHTHSTFATVVSIAREDIPACHYMIAAFGGDTVRCAQYQTFGTPKLSDSILVAMKDRTACLLANHGMIAGGKNLDNAMWAAVELETLAKQYYHAKLAGNMVILPADEMLSVIDKFKNYGQILKSEKKPGKKKNLVTKSREDNVNGAPLVKQNRTKKATAKKATAKKATAKKVTAKKAIAKKAIAKKAAGKTSNKASPRSHSGASAKRVTSSNAIAKKISRKNASKATRLKQG